MVSYYQLVIVPQLKLYFSRPLWSFQVVSSLCMTGRYFTLSTVISHCELFMYFSSIKLFRCVSQAVLPSEQFFYMILSLTYHLFGSSTTPRRFLNLSCVFNLLLSKYLAVYFLIYFNHLLTVLTLSYSCSTSISCASVKIMSFARVTFIRSPKHGSTSSSSSLEAIIT